MAVDVSKLAIVHYPDPRLRMKAAAVELGPRGASAEVRAVARRMIELMHEARGVGLAAPQVGLNWRLFVTHVGDDDTPPVDRVMVNPLLVHASPDTSEQEEGCLSIPGVYVNVRRPVAITLRAWDLEGQAFELTSDTLPARVWQHETDHLDGVLILDKMTAMDRLANRRTIAELESARR